eukprot:9292215-Alexandrium_andersonii.AAC.1
MSSLETLYTMLMVNILVLMSIYGVVSSVNICGGHGERGAHWRPCSVRERRVRDHLADLRVLAPRARRLLPGDRLLAHQ